MSTAKTLVQRSFSEAQIEAAHAVVSAAGGYRRGLLQQLLQAAHVSALDQHDTKLFQFWMSNKGESCEYIGDNLFEGFISQGKFDAWAARGELSAPTPRGDLSPLQEAIVAAGIATLKQGWLSGLTTYGPNEWAAGADDEFGPREDGPYVKLADVRARQNELAQIPVKTWQEVVGAPADADARQWTSIEEDLQAEIEGLRAYITANILSKVQPAPIKEAPSAQCTCAPMELCDVCHGELAEQYGQLAYSERGSPPVNGAKTPEGRNFDVEQAARAIESFGDKELAGRLRLAWQTQKAPAASRPASTVDNAAFTAWWAEFEDAHPDWAFADGGALRLEAWTAGMAYCLEHGVDIGLLRLALEQKKETLAQADARVEELTAEVSRLNAIINTPQANEFLRAVNTEAEHQRQRWGASHDRHKTPSDWFWLIGHLAGKALHAHTTQGAVKAERHIITTAAALANWHRATLEHKPG